MLHAQKHNPFDNFKAVLDKAAYTYIYFRKTTISS